MYESVQITPAIDIRALREVNRLKTVARAVANTAHDINNILQVVSGSAELLGMRGEIGPAEHRWLEGIQQQTTRAATVLGRLTWSTRATEGDPQTADLSESIDVALALRAYALRQARISVTVSRVATAPYRVHADRRGLLQVLLNLVLNAEAALADRHDATMQVRLDASGTNRIVSLADNGAGLSLEQWRRSVDPSARPTLGADLSGLGLWVSSRMAEDWGGQLDLMSGEAAGTTITLTVPAV